MIYLSGKITGDKNFRQKFEKTTRKLLSYGHTVYNPAILPNGFEYEQYMKIDFLALSFCDAIYLLDDWKISKGAIREFEEAKRLGIKVITEEDFLYSDTLLQICTDTECILNSETNKEDYDQIYNERIKRTLNIIRTNLYLHNLGLTKEENFKNLCMNIPEKDREFFYVEFLLEGYIMLDYDYQEEDSCQEKKRIEKMYKASEQMRELCENYYGINKNDKYILSA